MVERSCNDQNNGQKVWPKTRPNKALEGGGTTPNLKVTLNKVLKHTKSELLSVIVEA